jgi:hypothetical protein
MWKLIPTLPIFWRTATMKNYFTYPPIIWLIVLAVAVNAHAQTLQYWQLAQPNSTGFDPTRPVINGTNIADIQQTNTPTCAFHAALAAITLTGVNLEDRMKHLGGNRYGVLLFHGEWVWVEVTFNGHTDFDPAPNDPGEFWVALYQRAYLQSWLVDTSSRDTDQWARVVNGKKNDDWQGPFHALRCLTGSESHICDPPWPIGVAPMVIVEALRKKRCVVARTRKNANGPRLLPDHAYTVVNASNSHVELRNPYGGQGKGEENSRLNLDWSTF